MKFPSFQKKQQKNKVEHTKSKKNKKQKTRKRCPYCIGFISQRVQDQDFITRPFYMVVYGALWERRSFCYLHVSPSCGFRLTGKGFRKMTNPRTGSTFVGSVVRCKVVQQPPRIDPLLAAQPFEPGSRGAPARYATRTSATRVINILVACCEETLSPHRISGPSRYTN